MVAPKPGDVLTDAQARALPDGAVVDILARQVVGNPGWGADAVRQAAQIGYTVTLVSLPTPPDMAPGSVVLDDEGRAWLRWDYRETPWSTGLRRDNGLHWADWADIVTGRDYDVLHDAANPEGGAS